MVYAYLANQYNRFYVLLVNDYHKILALKMHISAKENSNYKWYRLKIVFYIARLLSEGCSRGTWSENCEVIAKQIKWRE